MINEKNVTYLYVGNVTSGYSNGDTVNLATMPAGSTVITYLDSTTLKAREAALAAGVEYEVINKLSDGTIVRSPKFKGGDVVTHGYAAYAQPTEQVKFLGYNGTAITGLGTITLANSYIVGLWLNHTKGAYSQQGEVKHISAYATDTTQATVVKKLVESHILNFSPIREKYPSILCERIMKTSVANTIAAITTVGECNAFYVTKGSKVVASKLVSISSGAVTVAAGNIDENMSAGQIISMPSSNGRSFKFRANGTANGGHVIFIGDTKYTVPSDTDADGNGLAIVAAINAGTQATASAAAGAAATDEVTITYKEDVIALPPYVIASVNNTTPIYPVVSFASGDAVPVKYVNTSTFTDDATVTFELDVPWQGASGYILNQSTTEATMIGIATADATPLWGLKFTGVPQPFDPQVGYPAKIDFTVLTDSFGDTVREYEAVIPSAGSGSWKKVAELEAYAQGNENWYRTSDYPSPKYRREAGGNQGYDIATVQIKNGVTFNASGVTVSSPQTLIIARKRGVTAPAIQTVFA